ncbi:ankyrin repeat-containing domain protein, partial [Pyronema domesticum]
DDSVASCCETGDQAAVEVLLEFGADIDALGGNGRSPLMYACDKGNTEIVRPLLENGANVNGPGKDHYTQYPGLGTPLHRAVDQGNKSVVDVLLEFKVDINALDEKGNSPLVYACSQWSIQRFKDIIAILLENGADVKVGNWGLSIPVLDHERWKNESIVEMLEEAEEDYED